MPWSWLTVCGVRWSRRQRLYWLDGRSKGNITVIGAGAEPDPLMRYGLAAAGHEITRSSTASR